MIRHEQFTLERRYRAAPARVFRAWADPVEKRRWFAEGEGFVVESYELDFRVGGLERTRYRFGEGPAMTNDTFFHVVDEDRRIVCSYGMTMAGAPFSVSLATLTLEPEGQTTLLRYTEQAAFLTDLDHLESRRRGCAEMLEKLAAALDAPG